MNSFTVGGCSLSFAVLLLEQSKTLKQNINIKKSSLLVEYGWNKVGSFSGQGGLHSQTSKDRKPRVNMNGGNWENSISFDLLTRYKLMCMTPFIHLEGFYTFMLPTNACAARINGDKPVCRVQGKSAWFSYDWRKSNYFHVPFKSDF